MYKAKSNGELMGTPRRAEKKHAYQQVMKSSKNEMVDEVYDQEYEYHHEEAPQNTINIQVQPPPAPNQLGTDITATPLHLFSPDGLCSCIKEWVVNDINYMPYLSKTKQIFANV
eukprot:1115607_1